MNFTKLNIAKFKDFVGIIIVLLVIWCNIKPNKLITVEFYGWEDKHKRWIVLPPSNTYMISFEPYYSAVSSVEIRDGNSWFIDQRDRIFQFRSAVNYFVSGFFNNHYYKHQQTPLCIYLCHMTLLKLTSMRNFHACL